MVVKVVFDDKTQSIENLKSVLMCNMISYDGYYSFEECPDCDFLDGEIAADVIDNIKEVINDIIDENNQNNKNQFLCQDNHLEIWTKILYYAEKFPNSKITIL